MRMFTDLSIIAKNWQWHRCAREKGETDTGVLRSNAKEHRVLQCGRQHVTRTRDVEQQKPDTKKHLPFASVYVQRGTTSLW